MERPHVRALTRKDVTFDLHCLPEEVPLPGNVQASGDDDQDREAEALVMESYESGNTWAWCCVRVVAKWELWEGDDFLGCVSELSSDPEQSFRDGGYFDDMKDEALHRLNQAVQDAAKILEANA